MDFSPLATLEVIGPIPLALWRMTLFTEIDMELHSENVKEKASNVEASPGITV
jgi:hypothetical protein